MDDPVYLRGRSRTLVLTRDHLWITTPDGHTVGYFGLEEVSRIGLLGGGDDFFRFGLWFVSPDAEVEGRRLQRNPYLVDVGHGQIDEIGHFVENINQNILRHRRISVSPLAVPPPPSRGHRADLDAAVARLPLTEGVDRAPHLAWVQHFLRSDEAVLDVVDMKWEDHSGLLALTTLRLIAVCAQPRWGYEIGLQSLTDSVVAEHDETWVRFRDRFSAVGFRAPHQQAERMAAAANAAIDVIVRDGSLRAPEPSPVSLFHEYELLIERRRLQMIPEDEFGWGMAGLMSSMPTV